MVNSLWLMARGMRKEGMKSSEFSTQSRAGHASFSRLRAFPSYASPARRPVMRKRSRNHMKSPLAKALDRFSVPLEIGLNLGGLSLVASQAVSYFHHGKLAQLGLPQWGTSAHLLVWIPTLLGLLALGAAETLLVRRFKKNHHHVAASHRDPHRLAWAFHQD